MLLDLATVKLHLRVDGTTEDALIGLYVTAAEEFAMQFLGRTIYATELAQGLDTAGIVINPAIQAALLLIVLIFVMLAAVIMLYAWPQIVLWLPSHM